MQNKKIILQVINNLGQGGAENVLYKLLQNLPQEKYQNVVLSLDEEAYYSKKIADLGIKVIHLRIYKSSIFKGIYEIVRVIKEIKPNIVQTWLYYSDFLGGVAAKITGVKNIIWGIRSTGNKLIYKALMLKILCAVFSWFIPNCIVANSNMGAKAHIHFGYCSKKFRVISNGFNADLFFINPNRNWLKTHIQQNIPENAILFGTLARLHFYKGYHHLINIIDTVCENNENAFFVLCGKGCSYDDPRIANSLNNIKYKDHVILINAVDNTPAYLNSLDIFVLPSISEGFPNALAEAMLCGLPCIGTDVGDVKDIMADIGINIEAQNEQKLAEACLKMLKLPKSAREQMGQCARDRIKQNFSLEHMTKEFAKIYQ